MITRNSSLDTGDPVSLSWNAPAVPVYVPYREAQPGASLSVSSDPIPMPRGHMKLRFRITAAVDDLVGRIDALSALKPGWNSYRAGEISPVARERAIVFVRLIADDRMRVRYPSVAPTSDGGVSLQWHINAEEIGIVFTDEGQEYSIARRGSDESLSAGFVRSLDELKQIVGSYLSM